MRPYAGQVAQWIGPYTTAEMDGVNATIVKGRKFIKVHVNRLKQFFFE